MDATTVALVAYLLGVVSGAVLMAVSIVFVATQRGLMGNINVKIPKFELVNAPVAVVFLVVGAGLFGGTLYLIVNERAATAAPAAPAIGENVSARHESAPAPARKLDVDLISASATSVHPRDPRGITYSARNALDGNRDTAWNADGEGIGESLHFEFASPLRLTRIDVVNGYAKDPSVFARNARLRAITIVTDQGTVRRTLRDTTRWQTLRGSFGETTSVTIEIDSIYAGSDFNDAALTEIRFWGATA